MLTEGRLGPTDNIDAAIAVIYGPDAKIAIWQDLKSDLPDRGSLVRFFNEVGIRSQGADAACDNYIVQLGGQQPPAGMRFLVARHDGVVPANWTVLDDIGGKALSLGRWNYPAQVLIQLPARAAPPATAAASAPSQPQQQQQAASPLPSEQDLSWPVGSWGTPASCARSRTDSSRYPRVMNVMTDTVVDITARSMHWFMLEDLEGGAPCTIRKSALRRPGEWNVALSCTAEENRFSLNAIVRREGTDRLVITAGEAGPVARVRCGTAQPVADRAPAAPTVPNEPGPTRLGACAMTTIKEISTRLQDTPGSGSAVTYANGVYQVGYEDLAAIRRSRLGDPVKLCVVDIDRSCKKGDPRAFTYAATNTRTGGRWKLGSSSHMCDGA